MKVGSGNRGVWCLAAALALMLPASLFVSQKTQQIGVTVRDSSGNLVSGLRDSDFELSIAGVSQSITSFSAEPRYPVSLGILLDESGSMKFGADAVRNIVRAVFRLMKPEDNFRLMTILDRKVRVLGEFTSDRRRLESDLQRVLFLEVLLDEDIVANVIEALGKTRDSNTPGRGLLFISDFNDSAAGTAEKLRAGIREKGIPVFALRLDTASDFRRKDPLDPFERLADTKENLNARLPNPEVRNMAHDKIDEILARKQPLAKPIPAEVLQQLIASESAGRALTLATATIGSEEAVASLIQFVRDAESDIRGQYILEFASPASDEKLKPATQVRTTNPTYQVRIVR